MWSFTWTVTTTKAVISLNNQVNQIEKVILQILLIQSPTVSIYLLPLQHTPATFVALKIKLFDD